MSGELHEYDFQVGCILTGRVKAKGAKRVIEAILAGARFIPGVTEVEIYNTYVNQRAERESEDARS